MLLYYTSIVHSRHWTLTKCDWNSWIQKFLQKFLSKTFQVQKFLSKIWPKLVTISEMALTKKFFSRLLYTATINLWPAAIEIAQFWNLGRNLCEFSHIFTLKIKPKFIPKLVTISEMHAYRESIAHLLNNTWGKLWPAAIEKARYQKYFEICHPGDRHFFAQF